MGDDDKSNVTGSPAVAGTTGTVTAPRGDTDAPHNRRTAKWVDVTFRGHYSKSNQTEFIRAEDRDKAVKDHGIGDRFEIGIEKLGYLQSLGYAFDVHND